MIFVQISCIFLQSSVILVWYVISSASIDLLNVTTGVFDLFCLFENLFISNSMVRGESPLKPSNINVVDFWFMSLMFICQQHIIILGFVPLLPQPCL